MQGSLLIPPNSGFRARSEEPKSVSQLISALKRCVELRDLEKGRSLHREAMGAGVHTSKYVAPVLIRLYSRCRRMGLAKQVFDGLEHRHVGAWNSIIQGYAENGEFSVALSLFRSMDCEPSYVTFVVLMQACGGLASDVENSNRSICLEAASSVHKQVQLRGFDSNVVVATGLVDMYCKCGSLLLARQVFDRMKQRTFASWNSIILGYVRGGEYSMAMELFECMDCEPSSITFVAVLKACSGLACAEQSRKCLHLEKGIEIHRRARACGVDSVVLVANTLLDMYSKCGCMRRAREVFDAMIDRTVVSWNCLILGYVEDWRYLEALNLFSGMDCEPDSVTYVAALKACGGYGGSEPGKELALERGVCIHKQVEARGLCSDVLVATNLVEMYSKCGSMKRAREVFDRVAQRDVVLWTCLIQGCVENGESLIALELFSGMDCEPSPPAFVAALKACIDLASRDENQKQFYLQQGVHLHRRILCCGFHSHVLVATSLLAMYCRCESISEAREIFDKMLSRSVVTWTSLILGYVENGKSFEALDLFTTMDCEPNRLTFFASLKACGNSASIGFGKEIHARVCRLGLEQDPLVAKSLLDFYGKCSEMEIAEELFNSMSSPGIVSWNTLLAGYNSAGNPTRVFELVRRMREARVRADAITLICILTACSRSGLVETGLVYLKSMLEDGLELSLKHCNCLIDLLGRANRLEEALDLIKQMPFEADGVAWMTLLGASWKWKSLEFGRIAADALGQMAGEV